MLTSIDPSMLSLSLIASARFGFIQLPWYGMSYGIAVLAMILASYYFP